MSDDIRKGSAWQRIFADGTPLKVHPPGTDPKTVFAGAKAASGGEKAPVLKARRAPKAASQQPSPLARS